MASLAMSNERDLNAKGDLVTTASRSIRATRSTDGRWRPRQAWARKKKKAEITALTLFGLAAVPISAAAFRACLRGRAPWGSRLH
jgi:hypothetical protein